MNSTALILIYHGSRSARAAEESQNFTQNLQKQSPQTTIRHAYLEIQQPQLIDVMTELYQQGLRQFTILPLFITAGKHVTKDIPEQTQECQDQFTDAKIKLLDHIGSLPGFAQSVLAISNS